MVCVKLLFERDDDKVCRFFISLVCWFISLEMTKFGRHQATNWCCQLRVVDSLSTKLDLQHTIEMYKTEPLGREWMKTSRILWERWILWKHNENVWEITWNGYSSKIYFDPLVLNSFWEILEKDERSWNNQSTHFRLDSHVCANLFRSDCIKAVACLYIIPT